MPIAVAGVIRPTSVIVADEIGRVRCGASWLLHLHLERAMRPCVRFHGRGVRGFNMRPLAPAPPVLSPGGAFYLVSIM